MPKSELWQPYLGGWTTELPDGWWLIFTPEMDDRFWWLRRTTSIGSDESNTFTSSMSTHMSMDEAKEAAEVYIAERWPLVAVTRAALS